MRCLYKNFRDLKLARMWFHDVDGLMRGNTITVKQYRL